MSRTRALRRVMLLPLALVAGACGPDSSASTLAPPSLEPVALAVMSSYEQARLDTELTLEKARIDAALKASQAVYDKLKIEWELRGTTSSGQGTQFLLCDPLQYVAEAKIVGPEGADIDFGPHKLSIPAGALDRYVVVTAEAPVSLKVEATFRPHGVVFNSKRPPKLTLSYKHCQGRVAAPKKIVYVSDDYRIIEYPLSGDVARSGLVWAWLKHFSGYVVAY